MTTRSAMVAAARVLAVSVLVVSSMLTSAVPAHADPQGLEIPRSGAVVLNVNVSTSGLPLGDTPMSQRARWNGTGTVAVPSRPTLTSCAAWSETSGWVGVEHGFVILGCSGTGVNGPASLNCELLLLRLAAVMEIDGQCKLITPTTTYNLIAAGQLEWVPTSGPDTVTTYTLAGALGLVDLS